MKESKDSLNRSLMVKFRVTPDERKLLNEVAESLGMDVSQYLRARALAGGETLMITARDFRQSTDKIGEQIGKIGSNVNQFARYANTLYNSNQVDPYVIGQFRQELAAYKDEIEKLKAVFTALLKSKKL